jgi:hypothetical protein
MTTTIVLFVFDLFHLQDITLYYYSTSRHIIYTMSSMFPTYLPIYLSTYLAPLPATGLFLISGHINVQTLVPAVVQQHRHEADE